MRMSRRLALNGGSLPNEYLFNNGTVTGHSWWGSSTSYASYTIDSTLKARASIPDGDVYEDARASVQISADLTKYKYIYFVVTARNGSPEILVGGTSVSSTTGTKKLDISGMTGSKTILIRSGTVSKTTTSGSVSSSITISQVWLSNR